MKTGNPDSNKILIAPSMEVFSQDAQVNYFDGEEHILERWNNLEVKKDAKAD